MKQALTLLASLASQIDAKHFRLALEDGRLVVEFVTDRVPRFVLDDSDLDVPIADLVATIVKMHEAHKGDPMPATNPGQALLDAERAAWIRFTRAVAVRWREDIQGAAQCDYQREIEAAEADLRARGVSDDLLRDAQWEKEPAK